MFTVMYQMLQSSDVYMQLDVLVLYQHLCIMFV